MQYLKLTSPYYNRDLGSIAKNSSEDAEIMLQLAKETFKNRYKWLQKYERIAILEKLALSMENIKEELALLIATEGGKPLVDAEVEVLRAIDGVRIGIRELAHLTGEEIPMGLTKASEKRIAFTTKEPIGIVVALSAFNHPLNLIVHQVIPAVAVGCPVIIKPASKTPKSCIKLVELLHKAGLPEGWAQVCICDNNVAEQLATDRRIGFLSFIGSAKVGWYLRSKLAPGVRCSLEHGGVAPVIFDETADIDKYLEKLVKGAFYHAGQVCVSVKRIYAHKSIAKKLATKLAKRAEKLIVGDPTNRKTEVGPLISSDDVNRVDNWIKEAVEGGAKLLTGGKKLSDTTYAPTVLFNPPEDAKVSTLEIFGPVICIYEYADYLEAIERANSSPYAFQAAVFTNNLDMAMDCAKRLDATAVMINDHTAFRVDWMPFGGRRQSGLGLGGIGYTMQDMVQDKMMVLQF
jgi:acyl-CoA reductase-like NAD-dependent aldehyde dehydrogenase